MTLSGRFALLLEFNVDKQILDVLRLGVAEVGAGAPLFEWLENLRWEAAARWAAGDAASMSRMGAARRALHHVQGAYPSLFDGYSCPRAAEADAARLVQDLGL